MIPVLAGAGHRVLVPDLIGFGRSDKPAERSAYTYAGHVKWMRGFLEATAAERGDGPLHLFGQDWGGLIGLRLAAENPDLVGWLILANTALPVGDSPGAASTSGGSSARTSLPGLRPAGRERNRQRVERRRHRRLPRAVPRRAVQGRCPPVPASSRCWFRSRPTTRPCPPTRPPGRCWSSDQARAHAVGARRSGAGRPSALHGRADPGPSQPAPRPVRAGQPPHPGGPGPGPGRGRQRLARRRLEAPRIGGRPGPYGSGP
ncbi:MAG: alpha/beta fold hydrolase, partial [Acidimicrobiaceae bacterium]|nr:alpha/beta fold hydrolase [Acidimicrobiaceae bacterium]MYI53443.1 alpha/beta fold hydrolase [Acidimicrobiaceae bacterium]